MEHLFSSAANCCPAAGPRQSRLGQRLGGIVTEFLGLGRAPPQVGTQLKRGAFLQLQPGGIFTG